MGEKKERRRGEEREKKEKRKKREREGEGREKREKRGREREKEGRGRGEAEEKEGEGEERRKRELSLVTPPHHWSNHHPPHQQWLARLWVGGVSCRSDVAVLAVYPLIPLHLPLPVIVPPTNQPPN